MRFCGNEITQKWDFFNRKTSPYAWLYLKTATHPNSYEPLLKEKPGAKASQTSQAYQFPSPNFSLRGTLCRDNFKCANFSLIIRAWTIKRRISPVGLVQASTGSQSLKLERNWRRIPLRRKCVKMIRRFKVKWESVGVAVVLSWTGTLLLTFMDRRLTGITLYAFQTLKDPFTDFRFEFNEACHGVRLLGHTTHVWPDIWFCHYEGLLQHHFNIIWHSDFIQYSNSRVFNRRLHFSFVVAPVTENEAAMNFMKSLPRLPFLILRIENLWSEQKESKLWTFSLAYLLLIFILRAFAVSPLSVGSFWFVFGHQNFFVDIFFTIWTFSVLNPQKETKGKVFSLKF